MMESTQGWDAEADRKRFHAWAACMSRGEFAKAWRVNDSEGKHWPSAHQYWDGKPLNGQSVCISSLHGLGDTVQMLRYAPVLADISDNVLFRLPESMVALACYFDGVDRVEALRKHSAPSQCTAYLEIFELPYIFRTRVEHLPIATHYLDRGGRLRRRYVGRYASAGSRLRVGIASQGSAWDEERWLSYVDLIPLLQLSDVSFVFLQGLPKGMPSQVDQQTSLFTGNLEELAGLIANLDLVISSDTLSAHLAGALGIPFLLLLKHTADWRWQYEGVSSPWYPEACLFRQATPGDWSKPVAEARRAVLDRLTS